MREMARSEMKEIEVQLEELESRIKILLLPKDPNDERNCMLEIRAGTGGSEANIFAGEIFRRVCRYCPPASSVRISILFRRRATRLNRVRIRSGSKRGSV